MIPIQDVLHRIQWDQEFGNAGGTIGYYDRVDDDIIRVPFQRVHYAPGEHFSFDAVDEDCITRRCRCTGCSSRLMCASTP